MIVDNENRALQVKLDAPAATNQLQFVIDYVETDAASNVYQPTPVLAETDDTTAVDLVAGVSGRQLGIRFIGTYNRDTAPVTLIFQYDDNGTV